MGSPLQWIEAAEARHFRELASQQGGGFEAPLVIAGAPPVVPRGGPLRLLLGRRPPVRPGRDPAKVGKDVV